MRDNLIRDLYTKRGFDEKIIENALAIIKECETYLAGKGIDLETVKIEQMKEFVESLIPRERNSVENLLALARYMYLVNNQDVYIYFTSLFGSHGVMENIINRIEKYEGKEAKDKVMQEWQPLPLGASLDKMPYMTKKFMETLESKFNHESCKKILAGNNHDVPLDKFEFEKKLYAESESIDDFFEKLHKHNIAILQEHADQKKIWYEQKIDQDVVDFVSKNQEILSGVRKGNKIYMTKIPYDIINYLKAEDPVMKRYYACHCPFVRSAVLKGEPAVSKNWCYCSAGFEKLMIDVLFDRDVEIELLSSPLQGDSFCRFALTIPENIKY